MGGGVLSGGLEVPANARVQRRKWRGPCALCGSGLGVFMPQVAGLGAAARRRWVLHDRGPLGVVVSVPRLLYQRWITSEVSILAFGRLVGGSCGRLLTVDFGTPSYKFTINICMYLIF
jgi:hypothetical protein